MQKLFFEFSDYLIDIAYIGDIGIDINTPALSMNSGSFSKEFIKFEQTGKSADSKLHIKCYSKEIILTDEKLTHYGDVLCLCRRDAYERKVSPVDTSKVLLKLLSKRKTKTGDVKVAIGSLHPSNDIFEFLHPIRNVFILFMPVKSFFKGENPFPFNEKDLNEWDLPVNSSEILRDVLDKNISLAKSTVIVFSLIWKRSLEFYEILKQVFMQEAKVKGSQKLEFLSILYREHPYQNKLFRVFLDFFDSNAKSNEDFTLADQLFNASQLKDLEGIDPDTNRSNFENLVISLRQKYGETDIPFALESILIELFSGIWKIYNEGYEKLVSKKFHELYAGDMEFDKFFRYILKILIEMRIDFGYKGFFYMLKLIVKSMEERQDFWKNSGRLNILGDLVNLIDDYFYTNTIFHEINKGTLSLQVNYLEMIKRFIGQVQRLGFYDFDRFLFSKSLEIAGLNVDDAEKRHNNLLKFTNRNEVAFFINRYNIIREDLVSAQSRIMNHVNFLKRYQAEVSLETLFTDLLKVSKVAIISDIHANLEAFQSVLQDMDDQDVDFVFCLGDIVGYGPNPKEVLELSRIFDFILMGNHENAIFNGDKGFNSYAKEAIDWTKNNMGSTDISTVARFLRGVAFGDYLFIHASPKYPYFEYINNTKSAQDNFMSERFRGRKYCFYGHTHLTGIYYSTAAEQEVHFEPLPESDHHRKRDEFSFDLNDYGRALINIGSVGQPRDKDPRACYVILENNSIRFIRLKYDINSVIKKIRDKQLPRILADRLKIGR